MSGPGLLLTSVHSGWDSPSGPPLVVRRDLEEQSKDCCGETAGGGERITESDERRPRGGGGGTDLLRSQRAFRETLTGR